MIRTSKEQYQEVVNKCYARDNISFYFIEDKIAAELKLHDPTDVQGMLLQLIHNFNSFWFDLFSLFPNFVFFSDISRLAPDNSFSGGSDYDDPWERDSDDSEDSKDDDKPAPIVIKKADINFLSINKIVGIELSNQLGSLAATMNFVIM